MTRALRTTRTGAQDPLVAEPATASTTVWRHFGVFSLSWVSHFRALTIQPPFVFGVPYIAGPCPWQMVTVHHSTTTTARAVTTMGEVMATVLAGAVTMETALTKGTAAVGVLILLSAEWRLTRKSIDTAAGVCV